MAQKQPNYLPAGAQIFEGRYNEKIPELLKAGFIPWTPADVMRARNEAVGTEREYGMWHTDFDTSLGIAGTKEDVIFAPELLLSITPETLLTRGGIALPEGYQKIIHVNRKEIGQLWRVLSDEEVLNHRGWQILAGEDQNLLAKYVEHAFRLGKDEYGYDNAMAFNGGVGIDGKIRALGLFRIRYGTNTYDLGNGNARIVGVPKSGLEKKLE